MRWANRPAPNTQPAEPRPVGDVSQPGDANTDCSARQTNRCWAPSCRSRSIRRRSRRRGQRDPRGSASSLRTSASTAIARAGSGCRGLPLSSSAAALHRLPSPKSTVPAPAQPPRPNSRHPSPRDAERRAASRSRTAGDPSWSPAAESGVAARQPLSGSRAAAPTFPDLRLAEGPTRGFGTLRRDLLIARSTSHPLAGETTDDGGAALGNAATPTVVNDPDEAACQQPGHEPVTDVRQIPHPGPPRDAPGGEAVLTCQQVQ